MRPVTTNTTFVKLGKEQVKRLNLLWENKTSGKIVQISVYATDSNYQNGKLIPNADVSVITSEDSIGFQYEYPITSEAYDFYFQIVSILEDKSKVTYNVHSSYKPDGNPGSETDGAKPIKP
ncbi:MAG: hypothetical protein U0U67_12935 [Chitinophagales bacterium]